MNYVFVSNVKSVQVFYVLFINAVGKTYSIDKSHKTWKKSEDW